MLLEGCQYPMLQETQFLELLEGRLGYLEQRMDVPLGEPQAMRGPGGRTGET